MLGDGKVVPLYRRPNDYGFAPDPSEHFELVGHLVSVATPDLPVRTGLLVSVGSDRLILLDRGALKVLDRLITTRVERLPGS